MNGEIQVYIKPEGGWYNLDIRGYKNGLLIQVWASVNAVTPELCPEQSANGITWPDVPGVMTHARADALVEQMPVFLNDNFLQRYEQSSLYDTTPRRVHRDWFCSPSYRGQWSFYRMHSRRTELNTCPNEGTLQTKTRPRNHSCACLRNGGE
jgi:hypothetical protein